MDHLFSQNHSKPEFEFQDDFPIDTKGVFQDLHQLDNLCLAGSSFHPGYDPFGSLLPYGVGGSNDLELYQFKSFEHDSGMVVNTNNHNNKSFAGWDLGFQDPKPMRFFVPDEGSCVTADNGIKQGNRKFSKGKNKTNSSKGQWTREEDRVLKEMVEKYGVRKWSYIAQKLKGRIGKQCRERWHNHLRPDIKKDFWTEEEDRILIAAHAEVGNKWSEIAKKLPGRTENSTKNHWNATKRRQYTRRKCRSKWPRPSPILQNYIKSLNLPRGRMNSNLNRDNKDRDLILSLADQEDFDYNEVPEFAMDEKLLEWDNDIDSLLDDLPSGAGGSGGGGEEVDSYLMAASGGGLKSCEVKKEMDLMEMISHVNL